MLPLYIYRSTSLIIFITFYWGSDIPKIVEIWLNPLFKGSGFTFPNSCTNVDKMSLFSTNNFIFSGPIGLDKYQFSLKNYLLRLLY